MADNKRLAAEYIAALRLCSIGIVSEYSGPSSKICFGEALEGEIAKAGAIGKTTLPVPIYWVRDAERGQIVADECWEILSRTAPPAENGGFQISADAAAAALKSAAESLGVLLTADERLREEAEAVVNHALAQFEELKARGGMKSLNKGYQQYRVTSSKLGLRFIGYDTWIDKYLVSVVAAAAEHSRIAY